jgi:hypothetical protein
MSEQPQTQSYEQTPDQIDQLDQDQLQPYNNLDSSVVSDALDEGYSPPERPWAVNKTGVTAEGQRRGESLEQRLSEELPDTPAPEGDDLGDAWDTDGELVDDEVGDDRAGRLVAPDEGVHYETEGLVGRDVGIDGAAASAEEAAVHVIPDSQQY